MSHPLLTGSFVACVTPFNADGSLDLEALRDLVAFQTSNGTAALYFLGTAGEKAALTDREWSDLVAFAAQLPRNGARFFFGCTGHAETDTLAQLAHARACGADGAVLTVPVYLGPTPEEAADFFLRAADASDLPLGIYNNPDRLMTDLDPRAMRRVFGHPNVVVYKEGSPQTHHAALLLEDPPGISVMAADTIAPDIITPVMALGGHGICNAFGNVAPREANALARPWTDPGSAAEYRDAFFRLRDLIEFCYSLRSPVALKGLMRAMGLPGGAPRLPLGAADEANVNRGVRIATTLGLMAA